MLIIFFRLSILLGFFKSDIILGVKTGCRTYHLAHLYMFAFVLFSLRNKTSQGGG